MDIKDITVKFAEPKDTVYSDLIVRLIYESAMQRGTGIAKRTPEYIAQKISGGKSVVALHGAILALPAPSRRKHSSWLDFDSLLPNYSPSLPHYR